MAHTDKMRALLDAVARSPGITATQAFARVDPGGSRAYFDRLVRRAERDGLLVRTRMPGARHVALLWRPGTTPADANPWAQARLLGLD